MDQFFEYYCHGDEPMFWFDGGFPADQTTFHFFTDRPQTAFVGYTNQPTDPFQPRSSNSGQNYWNMNKRVIEFLRSHRHPATGSGANGNEKLNRHMINERLRREKQRQSCLALHKLLPQGTKNDKNSIIKTASNQIQELQRYKGELERRNMEIKKLLDSTGNTEKLEERKIKVKLNDPVSGMDSLLEVLKCIQINGSKAKAIHTQFSPHEVSVVIDIETKGAK